MDTAGAVDAGLLLLVLVHGRILSGGCGGAPPVAVAVAESEGEGTGAAPPVAAVALGCRRRGVVIKRGTVRT